MHVEIDFFRQAVSGRCKKHAILLIYSILTFYERNSFYAKHQISYFKTVLFPSFFQLLGQLAYPDLKHQIGYSKVENEVLHSKCSKRIRLNDSKKIRTTLKWWYSCLLCSLGKNFLAPSLLQFWKVSTFQAAKKNESFLCNFLRGEKSRIIKLPYRLAQY